MLFLSRSGATKVDKKEEGGSVVGGYTLVPIGAWAVTWHLQPKKKKKKLKMESQLASHGESKELGEEHRPLQARLVPHPHLHQLSAPSPRAINPQIHCYTFEYLQPNFQLKLKSRPLLHFRILKETVKSCGAGVTSACLRRCKMEECWQKNTVFLFFFSFLTSWSWADQHAPVPSGCEQADSSFVFPLFFS